jgi:hypothetical protein
MCLVTEHARLKRKYEELEQELALTKADLDTCLADIEPDLPEYNNWGVQRSYLVNQLTDIDPINLDGLLIDTWYFYTDLGGWSLILPDLLIESDLYRTNRFDCEDYAMKAAGICAERYGLNSFRLVIGTINGNGHGFNIFPYGDETGIQGWLLWEPNDGYEWAGNAFEIGENGYSPRLILI